MKFDMLKRCFLSVVLIFGAIILFFLLFSWNLTPQCPIYQRLHIYCGGCGATRAVYYLLQGQLLTAFRYNFLFCLALPFFVLWVVQAWVRYCFQKNILTWVKLSRKLCIACIVLFLLFMVLRNLPFFPLTLLAPPVV